MKIAAFQQKFREFRQNEQFKITPLESKWQDVMADEKLQQQKGSVGRVQANYTKQFDRSISIITRLFHYLDNGESRY
jgi:hypothetical protein